MNSHLLLYVFVFSICYSFYITSIYCQRVNCNRNNDKHIDRLLARVITFGDSGRGFPETNDEVPAYCNETKVLVKSVENYIKKCTKALPKQLFSVYIFTIKSQMTQLCKKDSKRRRDMLSSAKCVNAAKPVFAKCVQTTVDNLQRIKLIDDAKKIPHLCCEYHANKQCNTDGGKDVTGCTEADLEAVEKFADSVAGNSMNILCGEYADSSDKCRQLQALPKNAKTQQTSFKSFFIPAIDVINSLKA